MALSDGIVMAHADPRRDDPLFRQGTVRVWLGRDVAVDLSIDTVELLKSFYRHRNVPSGAANSAVILIAQAKSRMRNWTKRRFVKVDSIELSHHRPRIAEKCGLRS